MQLWKSEVFVQILIDFWLNQSQYEIASHFDVTQDEFKPSEEHCRIVRMMMKNIHYFANGGGVVQSLSCPALAGLTDNLRRSIIPLYVQSRMYCFLHHALEHWTFDVVYRYVLELWLTYIQPWRYTDPNQPQPNANGDNEKEAFHIGWRSFIAGNLPFYINLLGNFLARANQLDLQLRSEVELLARVAKVFSQRGLSDCLSEEEDARVTAYQSSLGGRPIHSSFLKHHNGCSESNGIEIAPLFTSSLDKVYTLLNAVRSARDYADQQMSRTTPRPARGASPIDVPSTPPPAAPPERKGWTTSVWKFFMDEGEYSYTAHQPRSVSPDTWRTVSSLLAATERNLCTVFQIAPAVGTESTDGGMDGSPVLPRVPPVQEQEHLSLPSNFPSSSMEPEYEDVSLKLTPLGIDQIKSGLRKCAVKNVVYRGDPLLQPIRSYENPLLVRTFYQISSCLNEKFSPQLTTITSGNRFVYRLARELLAPPPPGSAPPPSREMATPTRMISAPPTSRTAPSHHRINLRPLASYYTLSYLFVVIMLLWLLNFKLVTMVILGLVCILFYTCFMYVCRLYHKSKHH
jgi:sphingomyelin phosphodiesterase 4